MAKVGKDDFVNGFVPHHNHGSVDYTLPDGSRACSSMFRYHFSSDPYDSRWKTMFIIQKGFVLPENGHFHHYKAYSGPAIPVGNGQACSLL